MKFPLFRDLGLVIFFVVGAAIVLALNLPSINRGVKNAVYAALGPVQQSVWAAGASVDSFFENLAKMNSAAAENERLKSQINDLMAKSAELESVKNENDFLRQGLNLELNKDFDLKLANIVAKNVAQDIIIIDQGSNNLVEEGMPVITSDRALVGKVTKTYSNYSEVTLVSASNFSFDVRIGDEGVDGLAKGKGQDNAVVDFVPKDKKLESGQGIFTSQLGGIFPAGLLVGSVGQVSRNDVETFQSAGISLAFDVNGSQRVFVASGKMPLGLGDGLPSN